MAKRELSSFSHTDGYCAYGYTGPLCSACQPQFFMTSGKECEECGLTGIKIAIVARIAAEHDPSSRVTAHMTAPSLAPVGSRERAALIEAAREIDAAWFDGELAALAARPPARGCAVPRAAARGVCPRCTASPGECVVCLLYFACVRACVCACVTSV